jgi:shikimate dehydrogenase
MQNAGFAAMGLNWRYLAFDVAPENLKEAITGAQAMGFVGLNLTVPHKILALDLVDEVDDSARKWGAVNTIRFEGLNGQGQWCPLALLQEEPTQRRAKGFNTDADAIVRAIQEDLSLSLRGASVLLTGAGGAGRAAALRLAAEGVKTLFLVNRTAQKAQEIAAEIGRSWPGVQTRVGFPEGAVDLLVNATSLGLKPGDPWPFDTAQFKLSQVGAVYDMIYRPAETPLLRAAAALGIPNANGLGMLLYQGAKALEIWTGQTAPVSAMREALRKAVYG